MMGTPFAGRQPYFVQPSLPTKERPLLCHMSLADDMRGQRSDKTN